MKKDITMKLKVTGTGKDDPSYKITLDFNFDNCSNEQMIDWALANRVVVWQNANRDLTVDELLAMDGKTVDVTNMGSKKAKTVRPMTFEEMIAYIKTLPENERAVAINKLMDIDKN